MTVSLTSAKSKHSQAIFTCKPLKSAKKRQCGPLFCCESAALEGLRQQLHFDINFNFQLCFSKTNTVLRTSNSQDQQHTKMSRGIYDYDTSLDDYANLDANDDLYPVNIISHPLPHFADLVTGCSNPSCTTTNRTGEEMDCQRA